MDRQESGTLSPFITGAVVGAGIALLFAPQADVELRRLLRGYAARAQDEFDKTIDHGTEMLDSAVERGQEFVEKGKDTLRETGGQARSLLRWAEKRLRKRRKDFHRNITKVQRKRLAPTMKPKLKPFRRMTCPATSRKATLSRMVQAGVRGS